MKKGFTLIELLAVIVILAIIALIATPIILGIINDTKEESISRTVENYIEAVELALANNILKNTEQKVNGKYKIIENTDGKQIQLLVNKELVGDPINIEFDGTGLEEGSILIKDGKVLKIYDGKMNNKYIRIVLGQAKEFETNPDHELLKGSEFNAKIKTLINETETKFTVADEIIKSIEFLSYGILPEEKTLEELKGFRHVDVSKKQDGTILAIYNGLDKVFIYSEGAIVFNSDCISMFENFKNLETIEFGEVDTHNVTTMFAMFKYCSGLIELDLTSFDTSSVGNMQQMFLQCSTLEKIDLSSFNTENVKDMNTMFRGCKVLKKLDLSSFDTSNVTNMSTMFYECSGLTNLNLSSFDTKNVKTIDHMFQYCSSLTELDLSNFDTSSATTMYHMFYGTTKLQNLNISGFTFNDSVNTTDIFYGAYANMNITINKKALEYFITNQLYPIDNITIAQ